MVRPSGLKSKNFLESVYCFYVTSEFAWSVKYQYQINSGSVGHIHDLSTTKFKIQTHIYIYEYILLNATLFFCNIHQIKQTIAALWPQIASKFKIQAKISTVLFLFRHVYLHTNIHIHIRIHVMYFTVLSISSKQRLF